MKFKRGQLVVVKNDIKTVNNTFPKGMECLIDDVDPWLKTYDIIDPNDNTRWITDVSEKDIEGKT